MYVTAITVKDKKGREIIIRSAEENDAGNLIDYLKITAAESPFLIREPDEIALSTEQEQAFIKAKKDSENELLLIAEIDGRHIGNCSLTSIGGYKRYRHRCDIAIALYKEYCGIGIGKTMLEIVLDIAKKAGYEQAELEVIADNKPAIALYEKLGFKIYGTFPDNMKYADGSYADAYWMMKKLGYRGGESIQYIIREIEKSDDKKVEAVIRTCLIEFGANHEGTAWADPNLSRFSEIYNSEGNKYWVVENEDGQIVGGAGIGLLPGTEDVCELQKMYCLPEARGTGVSHALMDTVLEYAKKYYARCYLETLGNMVAAQRFYEKYGFTRTFDAVAQTEHFACDIHYIKDLFCRSSHDH